MGVVMTRQGKLILRGVEWPLVFNSSGARGFLGEGYWFHDLWRPFGLDYEGSCFVAKTTTLDPRSGNMPLQENLAPKEFFPKCIVVDHRKAVVLNSVGLSGPGANVLIQQWTRAKGRLKVPWMVSFMSVADSEPARLGEALHFFSILASLIQTYGRENIGLQINFSCPNAGLDTSELINEVTQTLNASAKLGIVTLIKLNVLALPQLARLLTSHPACDGVIVSNTIPWGKIRDRIDWKGLFGTETSPLSHIGGGGLSGRPLLAIVGEWVQSARTWGLTKPIIAGGGILSKADAHHLFECGASAIELGSISILRPWRVRGIIRDVRAQALV